VPITIAQVFPAAHFAGAVIAATLNAKIDKPVTVLIPPTT